MEKISPDLIAWCHKDNKGVYAINCKNCVLFLSYKSNSAFKSVECVESKFNPFNRMMEK